MDILDISISTNKNNKRELFNNNSNDLNVSMFDVIKMNL